MAVPDLSEARLYTTKEASEFLRVSVATIKAWAKRGRLQGIRVGPRKLLWDQAQLMGQVSAYEIGSDRNSVGAQDLSSKSDLVGANEKNQFAPNEKNQFAANEKNQDSLLREAG